MFTNRRSFHQLFCAFYMGMLSISSSPAETGTLGTSTQDPSLLPIIDDPKLPRVLLIGDSISMGYTLPVRQLLKGRANVHRVPENGNSSTVGLLKLSEWLGEGHWDVIHFNWGLHDLKHARNDNFDLTAPIETSEDQYRINLSQIVERLRATNARLVWASTTPIPENCVGRVRGDEIRYNEIAKRIMQQADIPINDLHTLAATSLTTHQYPKDVHFDAVGSKILAEQVAREISAQLRSPNQD